MISLKRLFCVLAVTAYGLAALFFHYNRQEAVSKISIPPQTSYFSVPPEVLERVVSGVFFVPPDSPDFKKQLAKLRARIKVKHDPVLSIFSVQSSGWQRSVNVQIVNLIAVTLKDQADDLKRKRAETSLADFQTKVKSADEEIQKLRDRLGKMRRQSQPDEVDIQLARAYQEKRERFKELSRTFKDEYPELINLKSELASLEAQIMDAPFPAPELLQKAESELTQKEADFKALQDRLDESLRETQTIQPAISILSLAPAQPPHGSKVFVLSWLAGGFLLLFACFLLTRPR